MMEIILSITEKLIIYFNQIGLLLEMDKQHQIVKIKNL
jgi:hypothetical protein